MGERDIGTDPARPSRRTFLKGVAIGSGVLLVRDLGLGRPLPSARAAGAPQDVASFATSGLDGGGGVNCLAISTDPLRLVAGGDISGPKVSADGGATWDPAMGGFPSNGPAFGVCAAAWDPVIPDRVWLATGHRGAADGGLFVSGDAGLDWTLVSGAPAFDAGSGRPRLAGRLIVVAPGGTAVYLGAVDGTVWRYDGFAEDGTEGTATAIARLTGEKCASIALDPSDPTQLFVATRTRCRMLTGVDAAGNLGAGVNAFAGAGAPGPTEEVAVVLDGSGAPIVFAACSTGGVLRTDASSGPAAAWTRITPPGASAKSAWCSVDAVLEGDTITAAVGCANALADPTGGFDPITGGAYESVFVSQDAGDASPTWTSVCSGTSGEGTLVNEEGGPGGATWWGYLPAAQGGLSDNRLGAKGFVPEQLVFAPGDPSRLFAVGTQGAFVFDRVAATWYPAMAGLGVTANNTVHCDPADAGRVVVTNNDHVCFISTDGMRTAYKDENAVGAFPNDGFAAAFDAGATPSRVFLAVGSTSNHQGGVYYLADPAVPSPWVSLGRPAGSDQRPIGLAVRRISNQVVVLAAVQGKGIYRRTFDTSSPPKALKVWTRVNTSALTAAQKVSYAPVRWEHDNLAYVFDHASGIWRSNNGGLTWQKIWSMKDNVAFEGFIAVDPDDVTGGTVIVSIGDAGKRPGLWRLTGCQVSNATVENTKVVLTPLLGPGGVPFASPGPVVARADGSLWVVAADEPNLYASADAGVSWAAVGDDVFARGGKKVSDMDVGADGTIYLALRGPGLLRSAS